LQYRPITASVCKYIYIYKWQQSHSGAQLPFKETMHMFGSAGTPQNKIETTSIKSESPVVQYSQHLETTEW